MAAADQTALNHTHPQGRGASRVRRSILAEIWIAILTVYAPPNRLGFALWRLSPICATGNRYHRKSRKEPLAPASVIGPDVVGISVVMPIDIEKYLHHLDGFDLTDAQKVELIHSVSDIMESFVDQAFGVHPVQQSLAARAGAVSNPAPKAVGSKDDLIVEQFSRATGDEPEGGT